MVKKHTPEQGATRVTKKLPERTFFLSRRMCWSRGNWPFKWRFFTNWTSFSINLGKPKKRFHGLEIPESRFGFRLATRPFSIFCFWNRKRLFWIGDWEWKKELKRNEED